MQSKTDTVQGGKGGAGGWGQGGGLWTHDRNISNRYMLSTSDETGGRAAASQYMTLKDSPSLFWGGWS